MQSDRARTVDHCHHRPRRSLAPRSLAARYLAARLLATCSSIAACISLAPPLPAQVEYWVAPTGNNANSGAWSQPWQTITYAAAKLAPGDTLRLRNGVYLEEVTIAGLHGLPGKTIVIKGESRTGAIIRGLAYDPATNRGLFPYDTTTQPFHLLDGIHLFDVSYLEIRDLTVEGPIASGINAAEITELTVDNVAVRYCGLSGIQICDGTSASANNVRVLNCTTDRTNLVYYAMQNGQRVPVHGTESISIANVPGFEVAYCTVRNSFKEGIDAKFNSSSGKIHDNTVEFTRSVGIYLNEGSNCDVFDNVVRDTFHYQLENGTVLRSDQYFGSTTAQPNAYGYAFPAASVDNGGANGIVAATGDLGGLEAGRCFNNRIYRNRVYRMWKSGIVALDAWRFSAANTAAAPGFLDGLEIFNNTVYDCDHSPAWTGFPYFLDETLTNSSLHNNIGVGGDQGILLYTPNLRITAPQFLAARANSVSHNLVWGWSFAAGALTAEPNSILADPRFVLASSAPGTPVDLGLQGASPACDAGIPAGLAFLGAAPDMGAHEYANGGNAPPIAVADGAETVKGVAVVIPVAANDWDPNSQTLAVTWTALGPVNGTVAVNSDNTITYTPNAWTIGADGFEYGITDGQGGTANARVDIVLSYQSTSHYGSGVPGHRGQVPLLQASFPPYLGSAAFREVVTGAAPGAACGLLVGRNPAARPFVGITLLVDPDTATTLFGVTGGKGEAQFTVPIPWKPAFVGLKFYSQCLVVDPEGPKGLASSSGLECTIL